MNLRHPVSLVFAVAVAALAGCGGPSEVGSDFDGDITPFFLTRGEDFLSGPYRIKGRLLVLDGDNHRIDGLHDMLPDDLRAGNPAEVGTVGIVTCIKREAGRYGFFAKAFTHECQLDMFEFASGDLIAQTNAYITPPDSVYFPFWHRVPDRPMKSLLHHILDIRGPAAAGPPQPDPR